VPAPALNDHHGLVRPWERGRSFLLESTPPTPALARVIDRHWVVRWDRRGRDPFRQEILPHPSVNLVVEPGGARIWGVPTHRDVRLLRGVGWAAGVKFRPGAFTAVTGVDAAALTNGSMPVADALGAELEAALRSASPDDLAAVATSVEARLAPLAGITDPALDLVVAVFDSVRAIAPHARVEQIASMHHVSPRTLHRVFRRYVGVPPKWVLKRLRIHEAVEQLLVASPRSWTELALDLGYYDHAHFIRDFRFVVGCSPAEFASSSPTRSSGTASPRAAPAR
jgi:AraC-like DNA-binding protein